MTEHKYTDTHLMQDFLMTVCKW